MIINYDYIELYSGKTDSFLDHEALSSLLDYYAQATFSQNWQNLNFKDSNDTFTQSLEEEVLKNSFDSYWVTTGIDLPPVIYVKTVDSNIIVEKLGYQFSISNQDPFASSTTNKGFPVLEYKDEE